MSHFDFIPFDGQRTFQMYTQRTGETRMGDAVFETSLTDATYVIIGIEENAGPMANMGRAGSENAFATFIRSFLNTQTHELLVGNEIAFLGKIVQHGKPDGAIEASDWVCELDQCLLEVLQKHVRPDQIPIVVGGGHNNALALMRWSAQNGVLHVVNIDAHADLRSTERRHSGNSFSTALQEGALHRYGVFGLHEAYNNRFIREALRDSNVSYRFYEDYLQGPYNLLDDVVQFVEHAAVKIGLEIDLDAIANMPSSALSPSGWRLDQIRELIYKLKHHHIDYAYLHLTEAAPMNDTEDIVVGKALSYLVRDFVTHKK
ncbi:MAG: hypothetical protein RLZZ301_1751 [Bacteroidota bacterium]|jgi:formiminoglutamase